MNILLSVIALMILTTTCVYGEIVCVSPGQTPPIADGHYFVISANHPGFCLDKDSGGDDVHVNFCNHTVYQIFHFGRRDGNGCFMIHAIGSGQGNDAKYLARNPHLGSNPEVVVLPPVTGLINRWGVFASVNGRFTIQRANDDVLSHAPACLVQTTDSDVRVLRCNIGWDQIWILQPYPPKRMRKQLKLLQHRSNAIKVNLRSTKNNKEQLRAKLKSLQRQVDLLNATIMNSQEKQ